MRIPSCASSVLATPVYIYRETYSEREFCVLHEIACQSGSRARMAQAGSAGPCLRQHLLSPTVYTSCIVRLLITHLMHLSISIQPMCYTVKLHAMLYSEATRYVIQ